MVIRRYPNGYMLFLKNHAIWLGKGANPLLTLTKRQKRYLIYSLLCGAGIGRRRKLKNLWDTE